MKSTKLPDRSFYTVHAIDATQLNCHLSLVYYLRQEGNVFARLCLFVC